MNLFCVIFVLDPPCHRRSTVEKELSEPRTESCSVHPYLSVTLKQSHEWDALAVHAKNSSVALNFRDFVVGEIELVRKSYCVRIALSTIK